MTQRTIDWPKALKPAAQEWHLIQPMVSSTSAFSGATFDKLIGPPRWAFSLDVPDQPASMLPAIEAAVRSMRGGLVLVRAGDMRRTGQSLGGGGGRILRQLLPWSSWGRWGRAGPAPAVTGQALTASSTSGAHLLTHEPARAGRLYTAVLEVASASPILVSLGISGPGVAAPLGVLANAKSGEVTSTYGAAIASGSVLDDGFHRFWLRFAASSEDVLHMTAYALHGAHEPGTVQMRRPVVAMHALPEPVGFVASNGLAVWADAQIQVDGGAQAGDLLATRGWAPETPIAAGHWLNYGDGMHQVVESTAADAQGNAVLRIEPPIRRPAADGAAVTIKSVISLFKLKGQPRIRQEGLVAKGFTLEFEEYPT